MCQWGASKNPWAGYRMGSFPTPPRTINRGVANRRPQIEHIMWGRRALFVRWPFWCWRYRNWQAWQGRKCNWHSTKLSIASRAGGWAFDSCESQPANTLLTPNIGDLKTPPLNYCQTVADGATFWSDGRCEIIVLANAPKYSVDSH